MFKDPERLKAWKREWSKRNGHKYRAQSEAWRKRNWDEFKRKLRDKTKNSGFKVPKFFKLIGAAKQISTALIDRDEQLSKDCHLCGKTFVPDRAGDDRKYCSRSCRSASAKERREDLRRCQETIVIFALSMNPGIQTAAKLSFDRTRYYQLQKLKLCKTQ